MNFKVAFVTLALALGASKAFAGETHSYLVSGPIVELTEDKVVVQKGKDTLEMTRNSETKVGKRFKAKVGDKVTVRYRLTAESIEAKTETTISAAADAPSMTKASAKTAK